MSQRCFIYTAWIGIVLLALALRLHDLGARPIHADEATGARLLATQMDGSYTFNPQHFHGPLLNRCTAPLARLRGETTWSQLSILTLRLSPAVAGLLLIFTPLLWRRELGAWGSCAAAALLATSPLLVYYNRMYIHESWLALFAMLACAALYRFAAKPGVCNGVLAGLSIGLMFATKETAAISILSWLCAAALYLRYQRYRGSQTATAPALAIYCKPAALLLGCAALTAIYFYSDGFRHPAGIFDAVRTYFVYETTAGHEKPFGYYLHFLLWPKQRLGSWWSEALIALLALVALWRTGKPRSPVGAVRFLSVATLAHILIYSCIRYKTPWLMLVPWAHACLLAGFACHRAATLKPSARSALALLLLVGIAVQTKQSLHANGRWAQDARNPYAYVPTGKDPEKIQQWLEQLSHTPGMPALEPIAVVGQAYWPLPWYLRQFEIIGYWLEPIDTLRDCPIVFAMPDRAAHCAALLSASHVPLPRGLRANVQLMMHLRRDLWQRWIDAEQE
jgi:uncharacterized protein (TIGR03663 family)